MTKEQIERVMSSLGIDTAEGYLSVKDISSINTTSHGNQYLNCLEDFIKVDFENELILIKHFKPEVCTYRFGTYELREDKSGKKIYLTVKNKMIHPKYKYRDPKVGDHVFFINKKTGGHFIMGTVVTKVISKNEFEIGGYFSSYKDYYACYGEDQYYEEEQEFKFVEHPTDRTLKFKCFPISDSKADIYIDFKNIVGFTMQTNLVGF